MAAHPAVDVNLFVHNGAATVALVLESLLAQTWREFTLTLFDDGSTDATLRIFEEYRPRFQCARIIRARHNGGPVAAFQRAFRQGDSDFVMPKSADDPVAPTFIERLMEVLLAHPECAMCHAAGLVFQGEGVAQYVYPASHRLWATGADPVARADAVMRAYTSSPSFWGIYRRTATDRLAPIAYRAGWDHVLLAELALYGSVRHVPEALYWRRDGGASIGNLARRATLEANRGISLRRLIATSRWRTPLITTAYAHLESFAVARVDETTRETLMTLAPAVFRRRWLPAMTDEARKLRVTLPRLITEVRRLQPNLMVWGAMRLIETIRASQAILPEQDFRPELAELLTLSRNDRGERLAECA